MGTDTLTPPEPAVPPPAPVDPGKRAELILDALRQAVAAGGEHRLFRSGKLPGLFPARSGASAEAALAGLADGLLETVRTEAKGRAVVEWVRATPKGVTFLHDRDSPKAALKELAAVLADARAGAPGWLDQARRELAALAERVERQGAEYLRRLDTLAERVEAALRRADATPPDGLRVAWAADALAYLDRRAGAGAAGPCPLGELFRAVRDVHPGLTVPDFHTGLHKLHDGRAVRLLPAAGGAAPDPEFALFVGTEPRYFVQR